MPGAKPAEQSPPSKARRATPAQQRPQSNARRAKPAEQSPPSKAGRAKPAEQCPPRSRAADLLELAAAGDLALLKTPLEGHWTTLPLTLIQVRPVFECRICRRRLLYGRRSEMLHGFVSRCKATQGCRRGRARNNMSRVYGLSCLSCP